MSRVLRPFVEGTARGTSAWLMTERRVAATARDAAAAVLPLLGTPHRSAHRVRNLILPTLTCGWSTFDEVYEKALTELLALPPAVPDVEDPDWDIGLPREHVARQDWNDEGGSWTPGVLQAETVGPSGTVGRLVLLERRRAVVVADGRPVRIHARCECSLVQRRERTEVPFEVISFGRDRTVLEVRTALACAMCRAPVT